MSIQRTKIICTAFELLDEVGLDHLTMRRLAQALCIRAPSLYWHFANKQALIDGMADYLLNDIAQSYDITLPWQEQVKSMMRELHNCMLKHRDSARLFGGSFIVSDNILRAANRIIGVLVGAGASLEQAAFGGSSMFYYVLGIALEEQGLRQQRMIDQNIISETKKSMLELAGDQYPNVVACADFFLDMDMTPRFEFGIDAFIMGIEHKILLQESVQ